MARFKKIHSIYSKIAEDHNINNYPGVDQNTNPTLTSDFIFTNLKLLHTNCINPILDEFGTSIRITSAYRSIELNKHLGGVPDSQHTRGYAVDLISTSHPSSLLWNWCFQNLSSWNQLIWEYPEKNNFTSNDQPFSWVHISYIEGNNPKITSLSSEKENLHTSYQSELTQKIGNYTHGITSADENLI